MNKVLLNKSESRILLINNGRQGLAGASLPPGRPGQVLVVNDDGVWSAADSESGDILPIGSPGQVLTVSPSGVWIAATPDYGDSLPPGFEGAIMRYEGGSWVASDNSGTSIPLEPGEPKTVQEAIAELESKINAIPTQYDAFGIPLG